jgi:ATP-binding cassette subfamily C protein CydCD
MATSRHARERWRALATLAHHFHDVVSGLPTLRVFGRADAQRTRIEQVTGEYRRATMATLRLAFASSLALELVATMSVALVATEIGLRLASGHLDLRTGLLALILAPEAYLPLRALGTQFHATADGLAAAEKAFEILETPDRAASAPPPEAGAAAAAAPATIRVQGVTVWHEGRTDPAPSGATLTVAPGRLTVLTGPSGCGKTTLLSCLLGFTEPSADAITPRPGLVPGWAAAGAGSAVPSAGTATSGPGPRPGSAGADAGPAVPWAGVVPSDPGSRPGSAGAGAGPAAPSSGVVAPCLGRDPRPAGVGAQSAGAAASAHCHQGLPPGPRTAAVGQRAAPGGYRLPEPPAEITPAARALGIAPGPRPASAVPPAAHCPGPAGSPSGSASPGLAAGWLPQDPTLFAGTVAENIRLGWPDAPAPAVRAAADAAALDDVDLDRVLGERGTGLSAGQRRRVALARALLPAAPLLLLDEPTAGLDADREATVIAALRRYAAAGHAVVAVSHRPALIAAADDVVDLGAPAIPAEPAGTKTRTEVPA